MNDLLKAKRSIIILSLIIITAISGCKDAAQTQKPFSIQDLVTINNSNVEVLKEEDLLNAQSPLLSPDGTNMLFKTFEPDEGGHSDETKGDEEDDQHDSITILYTVDKKGKILKRFVTQGHEELESLNWVNKDSFAYLVSTPLKEEDEGTYLPQRKAKLYSSSIRDNKSKLLELTINKDSSAKILADGILLVLDEKTKIYKLTDLNTGLVLNDLSADINTVLSSFPKDTDAEILGISKSRDSYIIKTIKKPLDNSKVWLKSVKRPPAKIAALDTDNSHFQFIAWDENGIYLQGYQGTDRGSFYKYHDGILTRKQFPDDMSECGNFAAGKLTYETINYPDPDFIKVVDFDPDDNEDIL